MKRLSAIAGIASCLGVLAIAAPASAGTLDQQQTNSVSSVALLSNQSGAQTFTAGLSGVLDQADLLLGNKVGTPPDTVTIEIRTAAAGHPTATVLATGTIPTSAIGASQGFLPVTFATPASVTAGTQYALVAWSPGSGGNSVGWSFSNGANPYSSGAMFTSGDPAPPGGNWNEIVSPSRDFAFKTYVVPTPPSTKLTGICKGQQATIVGTEGNDVLSGTPARDVTVGLGGNDTLAGLAGDDVICGGPGKDTIKGGVGQDTLLGQKGKDRLKGGGGADLCKGGKGKDTASKCEVEKSI